MVVGANCSCFNYYAFWHIYYFSIPFHKLLVHGIYPFYRESYIYLVLLGWYNFCSESCYNIILGTMIHVCDRNNQMLWLQQVCTIFRSFEFCWFQSSKKFLNLYIIWSQGWDFLNIGPDGLTDCFTTWSIYVNILACCTVSYATFYFLFIRS